MNEQTLHDFEHWKHAVDAVCGRFLTRRPRDPQGFIGDIRHRDLGGLNVADIETNAPSILRERGAAGRGDDRFYFLVMQRRGVMAINRDDQQFILRPGEMALLDSAQAFEMQPQGLIGQLSVHLCRDAVDRVLPVTARRFGKLDQDSLSQRLLQGMLQQISTSDEPAPATASQQGPALQDALITLLSPVLELEEIAETGRPLRRLAERLINESLLNPPSPAELAAHLSISVRQLYRQFELDGDTVGRYIQRQRLERSARELADGGPHALPITTIAYKWGFTDSAHFSRSFKRHFGITPKDYRARQRAHAAVHRP